jgi:hypothetical protein
MHHKYRSKCRWNMLLHIDGEIIEIRPGEEFSSKTPVSSRHLEEIIPHPKKVKRGRPKKSAQAHIFAEELNGSSSSTES